MLLRFAPTLVATTAIAALAACGSSSDHPTTSTSSASAASTTSTTASSAASSGHPSSTGSGSTGGASTGSVSTTASSGSSSGAGGAGTGGSGNGGAGTGGSGTGGSGIGTACSVDGNPGTCEDTSVCAGMSGYTSTAGYCPGPANVECCAPTPNVADNPPVPAGWKLMEQSMVTADMTTWAVMILHDTTDYPMFSTAMMTFGTQLVMARVEWHPPDFQNSVVHRGVTLYIPG